MDLEKGRSSEATKGQYGGEASEMEVGMSMQESRDRELLNLITSTKNKTLSKIKQLNAISMEIETCEEEAEFFERLGVCIRELGIIMGYYKLLTLWIGNKAKVRKDL